MILRTSPLWRLDIFFPKDVLSSKCKSFNILSYIVYAMLRIHHWSTTWTKWSVWILSAAGMGFIKAFGRMRRMLVLRPSIARGQRTIMSSKHSKTWSQSVNFVSVYLVLSHAQVSDIDLGYPIHHDWSKLSQSTQRTWTLDDFWKLCSMEKNPHKKQHRYNLPGKHSVILQSPVVSTCPNRAALWCPRWFLAVLPWSN